MTGRWGCGRKFGAWTLEACVDLSCVMVGVNWAWSADIRALYVHVGPVILGVTRYSWRWPPTWPGTAQ